MEREKYSILVVEGDHEISQIVTASLEQAGFDVSVPGPDGLAAPPPDLILCGLSEGQGDGYPTFRALRTHPTMAAIPLILMIETGGAPVQGGGRDLCADGYLLKPFDEAEVLALVEALLQQDTQRSQEADPALNPARLPISTTLPHALRTPLGSILGSADVLLLEEDEAFPEEVREFATMIRRSGLHLQRLVEQFLLCAQAELVAYDDDRLAVLRAQRTADPGSVVQQTARRHAAVHDRLEDLRLVLVSQPLAMAEVYLEKIAGELLDNAFTFSEPGTFIDVRMAAVGSQVLIQICDQGQGMDARHVERLDLYLPGDHQHREKLGLGIHIVKRLVQLHDGAFYATSRPGEGTTVQVLLKGG